MALVKLPADFSSTPVVLKVEQKFGVAGMARMVKVLELLAVSSGRSSGVIELLPKQWHEALQLSPVSLGPFITYLSHAGWLKAEQSSDSNGPLRVTILDFLQYLSIADAPELFTLPEQWCAWCFHEMGMPPSISTAPESVRLFRRWCATNVTVSEVEAAIELAVKASEAPSLATLHKHLKTVRTTKIEQACR